MKSERKCCLVFPARIGVYLLLAWSLFFLFLWFITLLMLYGFMHNEPNDNFADSWITNNAFFVWSGTFISLLVPGLLVRNIFIDNFDTRMSIVHGMLLLLICALIFVAGGDYIMLIDICLNMHWL